MNPGNADRLLVPSGRARQQDSRCRARPLLIGNSPLTLRWLVLLPLLSCSLTVPLAEQSAAAYQGGTSSASDKKTPAAPAQPAPKGLDSYRLPADSIIVICEQAGGALGLLPRMIMMTPEKLKEMQDELERLRARLRTDRPQPPNTCEINGRVEGHLVHLEVAYDVVTDRPDTAVALGCKQAKITRLTLDGQTPAFRYSETEGFIVQVEKPGRHQVTARYMMGLNLTGPMRSLELDLPGLTSRRLDLHIPGEVKDLRVNDKPPAETLLPWKAGWLRGTFPGPLALTWKGSTALLGTSAVLTAEGKILARIDEKASLTTEAQLTLKVLGGTTDQWRLLVPPGAQLAPLAPADEKKLTIETQDLSGMSLRILRLKEPTALPLSVTVVVPPRPALPRPGGRVPIGPFALLGAKQQKGSVVLVNSAANLQVQANRPASTVPRTPTADEVKLGPQVRAFNYELPPLAETPPFLERGTDPAALSILELEGETAHGRLETRVSHSLQALLPAREGTGEKRSWQITTTLDLKLLQPGTSLLEVQLPADWVYVPDEGRRPDPVTDVQPDEQRQVIKVHLVPESWKPFQLTLKARSGRPVEDQGSDKLALPRPLGTVCGGCQVAVNVPRELELQTPVERTSPSLELIQHGPHEQLWRSESAAERFPEQIEVTWRPYRPQVQASSVLDLNLTGSQAQVRQELRLLYPGTPPSAIPLRSPGRAGRHPHRARGRKACRADGWDKTPGRASAAARLPSAESLRDKVQRSGP